jgi:biopolymer transport protein ExbB/TolQ
VTIENILFDVADALRYPVLIAALLAIVVVVVELGALLAELRKRRRRGLPRLDRALDVARDALAKGDPTTALTTVRALGYNRPMTDALSAIVEQRGKPDADDRIAKRMAEYDYRSMRRLERTRILVRMGPALGLMGTLIPLSPALAALAEGDVQQLTDDLRVAFSVTVAGLLVGMIAFAISLVRDRLYAQDYSDVEYIQAGLGGPIHPSPKAPPTGEAKTAATEVAQVAPVPAPAQPAPPAAPAPPAPESA